MCKDDTRLAAMLSHEIGHVVAAHGEEGLHKLHIVRRAVRLFIPSQPAINTEDQSQPQSPPKFSPLALLGMALLGILFLSCSRQREYEADKTSLTIMHRAGYDIKEAVGFYRRLGEAKNAQDQKRLEEKQKEEPTQTFQLQKISELLLTRPDASQEDTLSTITDVLVLG